jgi:hypothetical protein
MVFKKALQTTKKKMYGIKLFPLLENFKKRREQNYTIFSQMKEINLFSHETVPLKILQV